MPDFEWPVLLNYIESTLVRRAKTAKRDAGAAEQECKAYCADVRTEFQQLWNSASWDQRDHAQECLEEANALVNKHNRLNPLKLLPELPSPEDYFHRKTPVPHSGRDALERRLDSAHHLNLCRPTNLRRNRELPPGSS
ncbi:hypothetical protein Rhopal_000178-T1 [Rhodotorula paludigena]|uniref:Uncharacterized protein n=1 Tax=Rhodotorula paludigena TaxID=86838 RepID=A0AAV5GF16_9BASI|nr:hypothetical protein Rhopal_000178-T1 [Rhodotorula paludigena]